MDENTIPRLKNGLDRVLFKDPRTKAFNFDPYLRFITQPKDFRQDLLRKFVPPSADSHLLEKSLSLGAKYIGSTSSTSASLSQIYLFLSGFQDLCLDTFTSEFQNSKFSKFVRLPAPITIEPNDNGTYSILSDKLGQQDEQPSILAIQGNILEKFFTCEKGDYSQYLRFDSRMDNIDQAQDAYSYCHHGGLLLRSQLDCFHPSLPRKWFDIKTRATVAVRMNPGNYQGFTAYHLDRMHGLWNSFAREYYDMLRSAFLKYYFQVRIGNMDGLFVAYHNTHEIFGFQYVSREELDEVLFGGKNSGRNYFCLCLGVLEKIVESGVALWPGSRFRLILAARSNFTMSVYAEKLDAENDTPCARTAKNFVKWNLSLNHLFDEMERNQEFDVLLKIKESSKDCGEEYGQIRERLISKITGHNQVPNSYSQQFQRYFNA